jgi:3-phosphoshikimate 1-carboxyvinyltransferase
VSSLGLPDPYPIEPLARPPRAAVRVPGSKSYTNRALVCALLAAGRSVLTGALDSDDTRAMAEAVSVLGGSVSWQGEVIEVEGTGATLRPGPVTVYVRDSGTCARFLAPVLAAHGRGPYLLDGSDQLRRRPMGPMVEALRAAGVDVEGESLPLTIHGLGRVPEGEVPVAADVSSQFISGLLLAGFRVEPVGDVVSAPYIEMTRSVLSAFAAGGTTYSIEPDATAASYFLALNALFPDGRVEIDGRPAASLQGDWRFEDLLRDMPGSVDLRDMPDVAPTLAVVAVFGDHPVEVTGIGFTRGHETDRIKAVVAELRRLGIEAEERPDGFALRPGTPRPVEPVETYGDHRMAMAFALVGLRVPGVSIRNPGCVAKTFPGYWAALASLRHGPRR